MGLLARAEGGQGPCLRAELRLPYPQTYHSSYLPLLGIYLGHTLFLECYKCQNRAHNDPMGYTGEAMLQKPLAVSQKGSGKGLEHLKQGDGLTPREGQCTAQYSGPGGARAHRPKPLKSDVKSLESPRA